MSQFLIRKTATGYKFDLKTADDLVLATSEVYTTKAACLKGIQGVTAVAPGAPCVDLTREEAALNPKFEIFRDKAGKYRFRLLARNGKIIAASEALMTLYAAHRGVEETRRAAAEAQVAEQS